jgi:hypothetical protein
MARAGAKGLSVGFCLFSVLVLIGAALWAHTKWAHHARSQHHGRIPASLIVGPGNDHFWPN